MLNKCIRGNMSTFVFLEHLLEIRGILSATEVVFTWIPALTGLGTTWLPWLRAVWNPFPEPTPEPLWIWRCVPVRKLPHATAAYSIHAKVAQSSISLSCDSRGQCTLINESYYYAYVFIFLVMDLGKKQAMRFQWHSCQIPSSNKNNTSRAYLYSVLCNIWKYCLYRWMIKCARGVQTDSADTR